jgi:hypothetical protein
VGLDPHGKVPDPYVYGPDPRLRSRTATSMPGPLGRAPGPPLGRVRATRSKVLGFLRKGYQGLDKGQAEVRSRHVSRPCRVCFCYPLRRRPDASTRPTAVTPQILELNFFFPFHSPNSGVTLFFFPSLSFDLFKTLARFGLRSRVK